MFQFFVESTQIRDSKILIEGADKNHMCHVIRMKLGERCYITNKDSGEKYICKLEQMEEEVAICSILESVEESNELGHSIVLYQGLPKSDKMELIIQKAVELGVTEIVPVQMERSVVKLDDKKAKSKIERWTAIAEAAAKQSKRDCIPKVAMPISFKEALKRSQACSLSLLAYENERGMARTRELLSGIQDGDSICIFIGPEGGVSEKELSLATEARVERISLGKRILRTETAGLAILAMLNYLLET